MKTSAAVEVLADVRFGRRGARLHRLKFLHGILEAASVVLDTARFGTKCTGKELPECGSLNELSRVA